MTKPIQMIKALLAGQVYLEKESLLHFAIELEDEICARSRDELDAIDPEFAFFLDENINDICEKVDDCTVEERKQFIADVKVLYEQALAIYRRRHPGAPDPS